MVRRAKAGNAGIPLVSISVATPSACNVSAAAIDNRYVGDESAVEALVAAARRGSAGARDELIRRHQRQVVATATALVNDPSEAQDLAQEALADPSRFAPWLRKIVVGVSIDWLRSFRPQLYRGWDGTTELPHAAPEPSPLDVLLQ